MSKDSRGHDASTRCHRLFRRAALESAPPSSRSSVAVELPFFLWLGYHGLALTLAFWAVVSAWLGREEHGAMHRAWTLCAALLLPPTLLLAALALPLQSPALWPIAAIVPVLTLAAAWSNLATVRHRGLGTRLVHVPIAAWNGLLAAVYFVRALQDLAGEDGGAFGTSLIAGHAMLQTTIGRSDALALPIFLHLPICLPLATSIGWPHRLALGAAALASTAGLLVFAAAMPASYDRVQRFRADAIAEPAPLAAHQSFGVRVAFGSRLRSEAERGESRALWLGLGARTLCVDVDAALFDDAERLRQVSDELSFARNEHRTVIAFARPPRALRHRPAASLGEFLDEFAKVHWLCAERLAPDWLVLFDDPFGELAAQRLELGTIDDWVAACARGADDVRRANPACRPMIVLGTRAAHGRRLFETLGRSDSPLAAIGLSIKLETLAFEDVNAAYETYSEWLASPSLQRPIWQFLIGAGPVSIGGELGQWRCIERALDFVATHHNVEGLVLDSLEDGENALGLVTVDGRTRLAYRRLREVALGLPAPK